VLKLKLNSRFRKSIKSLKSNKAFKQEVFDSIVFKLRSGKDLEEKYTDHKLTGKLANFRECHIAPDILLIYELIEDELVLHLINIGSHAKLF
jgi:mRNA interferase YafQ